MRLSRDAGLHTKAEVTLDERKKEKADLQV
jgi:hypothetical protein